MTRPWNDQLRSSHHLSEGTSTVPVPTEILLKYLSRQQRTIMCWAGCYAGAASQNMGHDWSRGDHCHNIQCQLLSAASIMGTVMLPGTSTAGGGGGVARFVSDHSQLFWDSFSKTSIKNGASRHQHWELCHQHAATTLRNQQTRECQNCQKSQEQLWTSQTECWPWSRWEQTNQYGWLSQRQC